MTIIIIKYKNVLLYLASFWGNKTWKYFLQLTMNYLYRECVGYDLVRYMCCSIACDAARWWGCQLTYRWLGLRNIQVRHTSTTCDSYSHTTLLLLKFKVVVFAHRLATCWMMIVCLFVTVVVATGQVTQHCLVSLLLVWFEARVVVLVDRPATYRTMMVVCLEPHVNTPLVIVVAAGQAAQHRVVVVGLETDCARARR